LGALGGGGAAGLRDDFGAAAAALADLARGRDARPVVPSRAPRSLGRETTFPEDVRDPAVLHATLVALADAVAARLRRHGLRARTITLKVRYAPFRTVTRRRTLDAPACATAAILQAVLDLFRPEDEPVRLLGVSASGFSAQASLFEAADGRRQEALDRAVDSARVRFGPAAVRRASALDAFLHADPQAPA
jgi:DNA polymerase-4